MSRDEQLSSLAASQRGLVTIDQARRIGLTDAAIRHRRARGDWHRITKRVMRAAGAPFDAEARLLAAILHMGAGHMGAGALGCRTSAAALWGLPGFQLEPVEILVAHGPAPRRCPLAEVHTSRDLLDSHRAVRSGIPLTTPARTLFDLAQREHPARVERALDHALARRLCDVSLLQRTLRELQDRGRAGIALMRALVDERVSDGPPPESALEARVVAILRRACERPLRRQVEVGGATWIGRADFADDELPIVLEVQSELFHGSLSDRRRDAERRAGLEHAGYLVGEVDEVQVWHRPDEVVDLVRSLRREARKRLLVRESDAMATGTRTRSA